jgi:iron complex outermembrane recepter protein
MKNAKLAGAVALVLPFAVGLAHADEPAPAPAPATVASSDAAPVIVSITAARPSSLPTEIPTALFGLTHDQIERQINATDSEDALKYFPSLLVRKRYAGDYNHAILSSRASGTGNSARSAVYADGVLLSNWLGNGVGGLSFPPRWGLVTPEEIERVDVMYGPFSAAYPGNSAGAIVDYVTRMPQAFEAHAKVGVEVQPFDLYGTHATYRSWRESVALGDRQGDFSWRVDVEHASDEGQPLTFATRLASAGARGGAGLPVTGAATGRNSANAPWYVLGGGTQYDSRQDHLKLKLAYDFTPQLRASYVFGLWRNDAGGRSTTYLRDGAGSPVWSGPVSIGGTTFTAALTGADFPSTLEAATHAMHGLSVKQHSGGAWDWEVAASLYDYGRDQKRQNAATNTGARSADGGAGTIADGAGSGWNTFALKGIWRPQGQGGTQIAEFGAQQDDFRLRYRTSNIASDYLTDDAGALASDVEGRTTLQSLWGQDAWRFAPGWKAVLGGRLEHWTAQDGLTMFSAATTRRWPERHLDDFSPKAAVSLQWRPDTVLKASLGRAVRMPTVSELYGATSATNSQYINDPDLHPERSWTSELSAEQDLGQALARLTFFTEDTRDALYSQTLFDANANRNVTRVQNIGRIATQGLEAVYEGQDIGVPGLDLSGSVTWTHSIIERNDGFAATPGDSIGKWQPNIPRWRATVLANWRLDPAWSTSLGMRYSGRQYRTLDNSDFHGDTYMGVSRYFVADWRVTWNVDHRWQLALGIDDLNNQKLWNFHPYSQRTYVAELKWDL